MNSELNLIPSLNSVICDVLKENFDVKSCENRYCWYTPWENHCRKVIALYPLKGTLYPLYWGYNFDYIPWEKWILKVNNATWNTYGKLIYHKTEKSIHIDYKGDSFSYINYDFDSPSRQDHSEIRNKYFVKAFGDDSKETQEKIRTVVKRNIPFMLDWFSRINSIDNIIVELNKEIESQNGFPFYAHWLRGFLYAKKHDMNSAIDDISRVYQSYEEPMDIPNIVMKKLQEIDRI